MKVDVIIIGSGLIGSMACKFLKSKGMDVLLVDNANPMAASKCSFGVWKETWVNKTIKEEYNEGIELLEEFGGGIQQIDFLVKPKPYRSRSMVNKYKIDTKPKKELFQRVDCLKILNEKPLIANVISIERNMVTLESGTKKSDKQKTIVIAKHIIVAAGVWTTDILIHNGLTDNLPYVDHIWGSVFKLKGADLPQQNMMAEWAPYKQSVYLRTGSNTAVFGDGAVVKNPKVDDVRLRVASDRVLIHMNQLLESKAHTGSIIDIMDGYRPYLNKEKTMTGKFVNEHSNWVISATGGAKNSTILCGHMAKEIYRIIKSRKNGKAK